MAVSRACRTSSCCSPAGTPRGRRQGRRATPSPAARRARRRRARRSLPRRPPRRAAGTPRCEARGRCPRSRRRRRRAPRAATTRAGATAGRRRRRRSWPRRRRRPAAALPGVAARRPAGAPPRLWIAARPCPPSFRAVGLHQRGLKHAEEVLLLGSATRVGGGSGGGCAARSIQVVSENRPVRPVGRGGHSVTLMLTLG